jgi:hypothetical protein
MSDELAAPAPLALFRDSCTDVPTDVFRTVAAWHTCQFVSGGACLVN